MASGIFHAGDSAVGEAVLSLIQPLGSGKHELNLVVELSKHGYSPTTVTAMVVMTVLFFPHEYVTILSRNGDTGVRLSARYGGTRYEKIYGSDELSVSESGEILVTASRLSELRGFRYYLGVRG